MDNHLLTNGCEDYSNFFIQFSHFLIMPHNSNIKFHGQVYLKIVFQYQSEWRLLQDQ